jgi:hypothetical protein
MRTNRSLIRTLTNSHENSGLGPRPQLHKQPDHPYIETWGNQSGLRNTQQKIRTAFPLSGAELGRGVCCDLADHRLLRRGRKLS